MTAIRNVHESLIIKDFPNLKKRKVFKLNIQSEDSTKKGGWSHITIALRMLKPSRRPGLYDIELDDQNEKGEPRKYDVYKGGDEILKMTAGEVQRYFNDSRRSYLSRLQQRASEQANNNAANNTHEDAFGYDDDLNTPF